jgi:hypothetical protein
MTTAFRGQRPLAPTRQRLQTNHCTNQVRWTQEDDQLLLRLVPEQPTPNWTLILGHFPEKTSQQVIERWERVIDPSLIKGSWTREEDETIIEFVRTHGSRDWSQLSELLPGRIGKQCRERWTNNLDPALSHAPWTQNEDAVLTELHKRFGNAWVQIAQLMPGRSDNTVKNRWHLIVRKSDRIGNKLLGSAKVREKGQ